jgi:hypothetical protein
MQIPTVQQLAVFRSPEDLCQLVDPDSLGISDEDFFNKAAQGLYQKLREAWVLARIGTAIGHVISSVQVKVVDGPLLDGILRFQDGREWEFEVVTVLRPGEQPGVEYRRGQRPPQRLSDVSGQPSDPSWIRAPIVAKVTKVQKQTVSRHLVAYLDYGGGVPDLAHVTTQIPEAKNAFETTWLITGAMFALLFDQIQVTYSTGNWKNYLDWLPHDCKP